MIAALPKGLPNISAEGGLGFPVLGALFTAWSCDELQVWGKHHNFSCQVFSSQASMVSCGRVGLQWAILD